MARRGRPPLPTQLKLVKGTLRPHRQRPDEVVVDPALPEPPDKVALAEWHRVAPQLVALGVLTHLDRAVLGAYCTSYSRWVQVEEALARFAARDPATHGIIIRTAAGNAIQNPLVGAANKANSQVLRFASELGLTPAGRVGMRGNGRGPSGADSYFT